MGLRNTYWRAVAGRAWTEAIAAGPWSSAVRFLSAVAAVLVMTVAAWITSKQVTTAAIWGLVGIALVLCGTFLFHLLWKVPADMSEESSARERALNATLGTYRPQQAEDPLENTLGYILAGAWGPEFPSDLAAVGDILRKIQHLAYTGELEVWGQVTNSKMHVRIKPEVWENTGIDLNGFFDPDVPVRTEKIRAADGVTYRYINLKVVRAQIEREWPKQAESGIL